ncbi:MFS transporter [Stenotrophomonas sp. YIM B06876]|uniref:MFS transporter n=1 Tax=Stenotrophomonas sp. YIM B06876 TaxID=3060211 RepID=UPI0027386D43|nr:MFS transporter [Stenotrophomonas sp. YIM B06876]
MIKPVLWTPGFLLACIANFLLGMSFYLLMPTLPFHLLEQLQVGEATVGGILASYVIAALLVRPFSGFIVEHFNAKHAYLVALAAYVVFTSGYLFAHTVLAFVIVRLGIGVTFAVLSTAASTQAIDIIPSARRGEGIGLFGLMSSLAMALGPMSGLWLMDRYPFAVIFKAAVIAGVAGLLVACRVRSPRKRRRPAVAVLSLDRFLLVRGLPLAFTLAVIGLGYGMLLAFAAIYGKQLGALNTGLFFTLMAVGMMVSRAFSGRLIDGGRVVLVTNSGTAAVVLGLGLIALAQGPALYLLSGLLAGFGFGVVYPAYQTMMVNLGGHAQRGTAVATYFSALDVGIGLGMLLAGVIAARFGLAAAFATGAALSLVAGMLFALRLSQRDIGGAAETVIAPVETQREH